MLLSDRVTGIVVAVLGAATAYAGSRLPPVPGQPVGPELFPMVIGSGLVVCGSLTALGIGSSFEDPEIESTTPEIEASREPAAATPRVPIKALAAPALLVFYMLAVDTIGFVPTAAIMVATLSLLFGGGWRIALPLAVAAPLVIHLAFYKLLRVPLPAGWLPMPWS